MHAAALILVLAAAVAHAGWNLLAKRASGGPVFVWLCAAAGALLWTPVAAVIAVRSAPTIDAPTLPLLGVTAILHTAYYVALQAAYGRGDLSVVYPVARGTGALVAVAGAIAFLGERPSAMAVVGAVMIAMGIIGLAGSAQGRWNAAPSDALRLALVTGAVISVYTLWDAWLVTERAVPALLLVWAADVGRAAVLAPVARRHPGEVATVARRFRWQIVGVALLAPIAYALVLLALRVAPVSYVAPAREVSILIGVVIGWRMLGEPDARRRIVAAGIVIAGMILATTG
jgi:drug/metabolite transporter (DMT)-like permease